jgi:hypothetical protein
MANGVDRNQRSVALFEGLIRVAVRHPGSADPGIEPHINRAPIGWNIIYCDRADLQLAGTVDVAAAR